MNTIKMTTQTTTTLLEHFCAPVIHPVTSESITNHKKLAKDPASREVWTTAFEKDWGNLAQGYHKIGTKGTNSLFSLDHKDIRRIPADRTVTYAKTGVYYLPQNVYPNCVRITAGANIINYPGELTTRTADLTTSKILWNSIISTINAKHVCLDIKNIPLHSTILPGIHVHTPVNVPVTHHR